MLGLVLLLSSFLVLKVTRKYLINGSIAFALESARKTLFLSAAKERGGGGNCESDVHFVRISIKLEARRLALLSTVAASWP